MVKLVLVIILTILPFVSGGNKSECEDLQNQIVDGKWNSYNMILDNCLVKTFIDSQQVNLDFYPLITKLNELVHQEKQKDEGELKEVEKSADQLGGFKKQLVVKEAQMQTRRRHQQLDMMLESMQVRVALIEVEIGDLMEKCLLPTRMKMQLQRQNYNCQEAINETLSRLTKLHLNLETQIALMVAKELTTRLLE